MESLLPSARRVNVLAKLNKPQIVYKLKLLLLMEKQLKLNKLPMDLVRELPMLKAVSLPLKAPLTPSKQLFSKQTKMPVVLSKPQIVYLPELAMPKTMLLKLFKLPMASAPALVMPKETLVLLNLQ